MTVKEFYDATGGGYGEMFAKFPSDAIITKFLNIFKRDKSFEGLTAKLEEGDAEGAFHEAHTLKGVILNLNLQGLKDPVCNIVEELRAGNLASAKEMYPQVKEAYEITVKALNELLP